MYRVHFYVLYYVIVWCSRFVVAQVKLDDAKAEANKTEKSIREETSVKLQNIEAEADLVVQRVKDSMVRY